MKDLTRTWQDIVKKADHQDREKVNSASFLEYYSRINVVEMSGKHQMKTMKSTLFKKKIFSRQRALGFDDF